MAYYTARAAYDFAPRHHDELAFAAGDLLLVDTAPTGDRICEEGWAWGKHQGADDSAGGRFPEAYIERVTKPAAPPKPQKRKAAKSAAITAPAAAEEIAPTATADYQEAPPSSTEKARRRSSIGDRAAAMLRAAKGAGAAAGEKGRRAREALRVWLLRNWFLLLLLAAAVVGLVVALVLYYEPCTPTTREVQVEVTRRVPVNVTRNVTVYRNVTVTENFTTIVEHTTPMDVMLLLDASTSMLACANGKGSCSTSTGAGTGSRWDAQITASQTIVRAFRSANNTEGNLMVGIAEWSSKNKASVLAPLTNETEDVLLELGAQRNRKLNGLTYYSEGLKICEREMETNSGSSGKRFKLCILITDGGNSGADSSLASTKSMFMKSDGYHIMGVGVGVATGTPTGASNEDKLKNIASCNNLHKDECAYFESVQNFDELAADATVIANSLTALVPMTTETTTTQVQSSKEEKTTVEEQDVRFDEVVEMETETETLCTTDEAYFSFLLLAVPLLVYLFYKPVEYFFLSWYNRNWKEAEPPAPEPDAADEPPPAAAAAEEEEAVVQVEPPRQEDAGPPGQKRFKWKVKETAYIRTSGRLKVDWGDKLAAPPALGAAEIKRAGGKRMAPSVPSKPDNFDALRLGAAADISARPAVRALASVYNGGEWQERVSRWVCRGCWSRVDADRARRASEAAEAEAAAAMEEGGGGGGGGGGGQAATTGVSTGAVQIELTEVVDRRSRRLSAHQRKSSSEGALPVNSRRQSRDRLSSSSDGQLAMM